MRINKFKIAGLVITCAGSSLFSYVLASLGVTLMHIMLLLTSIYIILLGESVCRVQL